MRLLSAAFGAILALVPVAAPAQPAPLPDVVTKIALIPGWRAADGSHVAAIEIRLAPGWHTYWRVPGVTGIPPQFDWSGSQNLDAVAYEWPRPIVFDTYGIPTIGYKGALVLPVILTPASPGEPVEAQVDLFFGVCKDICIPAEARLTARLEPSGPAHGRAEIEQAMAARPTSARAAGVSAARCVLSSGPEGGAITAEITFDAPPAVGLTAVIEAEARPDLWIGEAETRTRGRRVEATAPMESLGGGGIALDRSALRLTLLDAGRAIDIRGCAGGD